MRKKIRNIGINLIIQPDDKHRSGILIARIPQPKFVVDELLKKNIIVFARVEGVRISVSIFNKENDVEILALVLKKNLKKF